MKTKILIILIILVIVISGGILVWQYQQKLKEKPIEEQTEEHASNSGETSVESGAPIHVPDGYVASNIFTSALVAPWDLAFGPDGDLYVAEFTGSRISKVTSNGSVSTYLEIPESFRSTARSLAFSPSGDLYVVMSNGGLGDFNGILRISTDKTVSVLSEIGGVEQLAIGFSGDIFVAGAGEVFRITPDGVLTTFVSGLSFPSDIEFGPSGDMFVFEAGIGEISRIAPDGGRTIFASGFAKQISYMAFDARGNLHLNDRSPGEFYSVTPAGTVAAPTHLSFLVPGCYNDMTFDSSGNLYVADGTGSRIIKVLPDSTASVFVDGFMSTGLAMSPSGDVYTIDTASLRGDPPSTDIIKVLPDKTTFATISGTASDIDFSAAGDMYVAVFDRDMILKINPNGEVSTFVTRLHGPGRLAFGKSGDLFVLESRNGNVLRITPEGEISTFATGFGDITTGSLYGGLAVDSAGNVFVGSMGKNNTIYEIFPNGTVTTFASGVSDEGYWDFGDIAVCSNGEIFATEAGRGRLFKVTSEGVTLFATGLTNDAHSVTCGPSGELFIGRAGSIVKISAR
ncbi:MAG: hypothetical protein V1756_00915 [Patescibacteria group bacterium]